jgi:acyl-coenzyme A thioesterase PaaI-like protein
MEPAPAIQDWYPDDFSYCFGCGRLNRLGHQIKTRVEGDETVSRFEPLPEHLAVPGFVYGGLLASLLDCHGMATASAAALRAGGLVVGEAPSPRYVTAALHVDYLRPTPIGYQLELRARVEEFTQRKVTVSAWILANDETTARARIVAVPMPAHMMNPDAVPDRQ